MLHEKKVIVITGFSGKLAQHFAQHYHSAYTLVGISRNAGNFPNEHVFQADINQDMTSVVKSIVEKYGLIDVLIHNAVLSNWKNIENMSGIEMVNQFHTNVIAPINLSNAVLEHCWKKYTPQENTTSNRSILHISSIAGVNDYFGYGQGMYAATKAALNTLTRHQASELKKYGIRVNAVAPNSFPAYVPTDRVCESMHTLISGNMSGEIRVLDHQPEIEKQS